jgi:hypothetical protein
MGEMQKQIEKNGRPLTRSSSDFVGGCSLFSWLIRISSAQNQEYSIYTHNGFDLAYIFPSMEKRCRPVLFFSAVILGHSSADYKEYTGQQGEASVKKERKYRRPRE